MNERIKELAEQAENACAHIGQNFAWEWEQKFAELIIKDCAEVYRANVKRFRPLFPTEFSNALIEHFGVNNEDL
jgi:hypothetical protein